MYSSKGDVLLVSDGLNSRIIARLRAHGQALLEINPPEWKSTSVIGILNPTSTHLAPTSLPKTHNSFTPPISTPQILLPLPPTNAPVHPSNVNHLQVPPLLYPTFPSPPPLTDRASISTSDPPSAIPRRMCLTPTHLGLTTTTTHYPTVHTAEAPILR